MEYSSSIKGPAPPISDPDLLCTNGGSNSLDPTTEACPLYNNPIWPIECPTVRTYALMQQATAQVVAEGNRYRLDRGMKALQWNHNLSAAAQRHASYLAVLGSLTHDETDVLHRTPAIRADTQFYRGGKVAELLYDGTTLPANEETPMRAFCDFKDSYVSDAQPNHFHPFVNSTDPDTAARQHIGIGWKNGYYVFLFGGGGTFAEKPPEAYIVDPELNCTSGLIDPKTEPCPEFSGTWPIECPTVRTYALMQQATAQAVAEANRFRTNRGLKPLAWSDNLAAAAQWQATYIFEQNPLPANTGINIHDSPNGTHGATLKERILDAGYDPAFYVEGVTMTDAFICNSYNPNTAFCKLKDSYIDDQQPSSFFPFTGKDSDVVKALTHIGIGNRCGVWVFVYAALNTGSTPTTPAPDIEDETLLCNQAQQLGADPLTEPCPTFDATSAGWPIECPTVRTYALMQQATAQAVAEGNRYRTTRGQNPLAWDDNLAAAAQWHATYLEKHSFNDLRSSEDPNHEYYKAITFNDRSILAGYIGGTFGTVVQVTGDPASEQNPTKAFCKLKDTYVSDKQQGSFAPYISTPYITRIGIGFSKRTNANETVFVFVYGAERADGQTIVTPAPPIDTKDYLLNCPIANTGSGIPGIGDGTVVPYNPLQFPGVYAGSKDFNPASTYPKTRGCPPYNVTGYPQTCPEKRTWAYIERIFQPLLDEGNVYRTAKGFAGLKFDRWLALAAQRHATYVAENWDRLYKNPTGTLFIKYGSLLATHWEEETNSFGKGVGNRVANTGRNSPSVAEGIAFGSQSPMEGLCNQKADYVSDANPGHFGPWYTDGNQKYVGWGIDRAINNGWIIQVWVYSTQEPGAGATPLNELWMYLPKFGCLT